MIELLLSEHRAIIQDAFAVTLIAIALIWGGGPERVFALTWLILFEAMRFVLIELAAQSVTFDTLDPYLATLDIVALAVFMVCALYANRNYLLWIASMQVLAVTAHLARGMVEGISQISYALMAYLPGWLQLLFFSIGLARHIHRKRQYGPYRDWRMASGWPKISLPPEKKWRVLAMLGHDFFASRSK